MPPFECVERPSRLLCAKDRVFSKMLRRLSVRLSHAALPLSWAMCDALRPWDADEVNEGT
jgi:hypothetical protein